MTWASLADHCLDQPTANAAMAILFIDLTADGWAIHGAGAAIGRRNCKNQGRDQ